MNKPLVTEKLYDADAYCRAFTATVISCEEAEDREGLYAVVLNRSAFFPEGGGQYADTGTLQEFKKDCETPLSGAVKVVDVQVSDDGIITHYCDGAVTPWAQVTGVLDWEQRFERMQNHTGEHLVSGTVHRLYGLDNIGFHLGDRDVTCDFNGELSDEQLREVERVVNRAVWENVEVYAEYPDPATLPDLDYRSKLELTEDVRLVTIPGYDVCACCAPHVARTGEIGLIKIVNSEKAHGGTRVHMICGPWALADYDIKQTNIMRIVDLTSTPQEETADAVEALQAQNGHLTHELSVAQVQQADIALSFLKEQGSAETSGNRVVFLPSLETDAIRALANGGRDLCDGVFVALTAGEKDLGPDGQPQSYRYIATSKSLPLSRLAKEFNASLNGRGGGRDEMVQGSFGAPLEDIVAFFRDHRWKAEG
ncbi:MAG: alanyl-tRNA editing protein [Clostridia bacterium]|nr:alanyl-tRNA editing protein [Clostridia bacterium]MBQ1549049.1 alanyl-tRNA editing protein [Clostridia bacterium]